jgi:multisubunit Na+/H+ antiporter MnhC subunit
MPALALVLFAIVITGTYLALRRGLGNPRRVMMISIAASAMTMGLAQIARVSEGGSPLLAGLIGGALGIVGSISILIMARYFQQRV